VARSYKNEALTIRERDKLFRQKIKPKDKIKKKPEAADDKEKEKHPYPRKSEQDNDKDRHRRIVNSFKNETFVPSQFLREVRPESCIWHNTTSHQHLNYENINELYRSHPTQPFSQSKVSFNEYQRPMQKQNSYQRQPSYQNWRRAVPPPELQGPRHQPNPLFYNRFQPLQGNYQNNPNQNQPSDCHTMHPSNAAPRKNGANLQDATNALNDINQALNDTNNDVANYSNKINCRTVSFSIPSKQRHNKDHIRSIYYFILF